MARERPTLGVPFGADGPWLAAILDVLGDLHDLIEARLPASQPSGGGPVPISEPAPAGLPTKSVPVSEPATDDRPDEDDEQSGEVSEPAPDGPPVALPPRAGRGSSLEAWRAFADQVKVAVPVGASRDDIIAACEDAGVIAAR